MKLSHLVASGLSRDLLDMKKRRAVPREANQGEGEV